MRRRPPRSTRTDPLFPSTTLCRSGLAERASHRPGRLSGGEQQRAAIARGLANDPSILLADEPTGNLDPDTADGVFAGLLHLVRDGGLAAVIATHNLDLARRMDRILRLEHGRIVERSEEHTSELQSLMRSSYAVFCLK